MQDGASAVYIAAENGHKKVVELLIKANADVNAKTKVFATSPRNTCRHKDTQHKINTNNEREC